MLSGLAMEIAGSSRPCSGSEHLISHAIDQLYPGTARHGEQVAFGALLCSRFQGEDWPALKRLMASAGMERAVSGFGLSEERDPGRDSRGSRQRGPAATRCSTSSS